MTKQSKLFTKNEYTSQYTRDKIEELKWGDQGDEDV